MEELKMGEVKDGEKKPKRNCDKLSRVTDIMFVLVLILSIVYVFVMGIEYEQTVIFEEVLGTSVAKAIITIAISYLIRLIIHCFCDLVENSYKD